MTTPGMIEITTTTDRLKLQVALISGSGLTGRRGALSLIFLIVVCVVLTVLDTGIEWAAVFGGLSGSSKAKRKQGFTLPLSDEPPSVRDSISSLVIHTNATREVILIEPDMMLSASIFKYFFISGCFTMRNRKRRKNCNSLAPKTKLDKILKNVVILYEPRVGATAKANCLLFNVRHPVDRVASWYKYVHPDNCEGNNKWHLACAGKKQIEKDPDGLVASFFERCFPTIEDLAESFAIQTTIEIKTADANSNQTSCNDLAYELFQSGKQNGNAIFIDMASNFRYYHNKTLRKYPEKEVWALRSDHVLEDLNALEVLLGGEDGQYGLEYAANLTSPFANFMQKQTLSGKVTKLLCCALRDEFVVVNDVLHRAANFDNVMKYQAWSETLNRCGFGSWADFQNECKTLVRS
jgi:hypothetical protein